MLTVITRIFNMHILSNKCPAVVNRGMGSPRAWIARTRMHHFVRYANTLIEAKVGVTRWKDDVLSCIRTLLQQGAVLSVEKDIYSSKFSQNRPTTRWRHIVFFREWQSSFFRPKEVHRIAEHNIAVTHRPTYIFTYHSLYITLDAYFLTLGRRCYIWFRPSRDLQNAPGLVFVRPTGAELWANYFPA